MHASCVLIRPFSCVQLFATLQTIARQVPLSMGFSRQEYWSGFPVLLQGIFLTRGSKLHLLHWQPSSLPLAPPGKPIHSPSEWVKSLSHVRLFATPWTVAYQASPSMGFSRQEYWSGLPFPSLDLPNPGIEPGSPALQADASPSEPPGKLIHSLSSFQIHNTVIVNFSYHVHYIPRNYLTFNCKFVFFMTILPNYSTSLPISDKHRSHISFHECFFFFFRFQMWVRSCSFYLSLSYFT